MCKQITAISIYKKGTTIYNKLPISLEIENNDPNELCDGSHYLLLKNNIHVLTVPFEHLVIISLKSYTPERRHIFIH